MRQINSFSLSLIFYCTYKYDEGIMSKLWWIQTKYLEYFVCVVYIQKKKEKPATDFL